MLVRKTWVLVANGSLARIFDFSKGCLTELKVLIHPATRLHAHATEKHAITVHHESQDFAKEVLGYLNLEHRTKHFEQLHVIAPPVFLGVLRNKLHRELQKSVGIEISKNLVSESREQIGNYLSAYSVIQMA